MSCLVGEKVEENEKKFCLVCEKVEENEIKFCVDIL